MSENESGAKRTAAEQETSVLPTEPTNNKKLKLSDEVTLTSLPNTLVLDKAQEDTINQLVESSATASALNVETKVEPKLTEDTNKIMEQEIVSADIEKAVTPAAAAAAVPAPPATVEQEKTANNTSSDDLNITSEQLLFALTSIPPTEATSGAVTASTENATAVTDAPKEANIAPEPTQPVPVLTTDTTTSMEIDDKAAEDKSIIVKELLAPTAAPPAAVNPLPPVPEIKAPLSPPAPSSSAITGLGITPNKSTPPPAPLSQPTNTTTPNNVSSIPSQLKTNNTNNNSPSLSLTSLPDISAALRRLSSHTVPASVIEQLSSSPRLPNIGRLNNNGRRASMADVSPSEILGNALAAVAANAAAASRSTPNKQQQQQQQQPTNAATAIGNLAAITANISNLLHSGGFHRNSFSQEDTQKLAAAVAVARNGGNQTQQQRRKSSMAVVGNAFSNMIDQAMMMNRNKPQKPKLIIKNEQVWKSLEGIEEKSLGYEVYAPQLILPNLEKFLNGVMEVRVPARYLTFENTRVKKRAVWGTDIYTDDSDVVAMAIHSGKYQPQFTEPDIEAGDPFALAVAGKQTESVEAAKKLALSGKKWIRHDNLIPDHDLKVTVRVLPTLQNYASSIRHRIKSREWGKHDGMSLFVVKVEKTKRGEARVRGRGAIKSDMFAYEQYRKQALGLTSSQQHKLSTTTTKTKEEDEKLISTDNPTATPTFSKGRVKKTRRVLRMFQIRSEMLNNSRNNMDEKIDK